jgi:hypothetical protein
MSGDGQLKTKIRRCRSNQSSGLRKEFAPPSSLIERANMGILKTTHAIDNGVKTRYMHEHCNKCMDYTHKGAIGQGMVDMDYVPGIWDFDTCHETCWHDRRDKNNDFMREYYWRKKAGLVKNQRKGRI